MSINTFQLNPLWSSEASTFKPTDTSVRSPNLSSIQWRTGPESDLYAWKMTSRVLTSKSDHTRSGLHEKYHIRFLDSCTLYNINSKLWNLLSKSLTNHTEWTKINLSKIYFWITRPCHKLKIWASNMKFWFFRWVWVDLRKTTC